MSTIDAMDILIYIAAGLILCFALYLFLIAPRFNRPDKIKPFIGQKFAHRGLHDAEKGIPENTLFAFAEAVKNGYGIELDVRFSKDKKLFIMHDESLERMTGVRTKATDTDWADIRDLAIKNTDQTPPSFDDVLALVDGRVPLIVELKVAENNHAELTKAVCDRLDSYNGEYILESFDPRVVHWLRRNRPDMVRGQLLQFFRKHGDKKIPAVLDFIIHNQLINVFGRPDFIATYYDDRRALSMRLSRALFDTPEFDWTVKEQSQADDCEKDGAAYIFEGFIPKE